jgi:protein-S-isoprenylcysteine O-methyltransferase Ste14
MDVLRVLINTVLVLWAILELWRMVREVSRRGRIADGGSRFVIAVCLFFGAALTIKFNRENTWSLGHADFFAGFGLALMACGLVLRAWAVVTLGKFFTGTVMIQADHRVVDKGPYHLLRHPSYTGLGMILMGYALTTASAAALIIVVVATVVGLGYRINVGESALVDALGDSYQCYAAKTKRVIPFVY